MEPLLEKTVPEDGLAVEVDVLTLLRLRDRMKQQLMEYATAAHASQENDPHPITSKSVCKRYVTSATEDLERDMEKLKTSFQNKTLALQRIQVTAALRNKVMQNDNDSRLIMETVKQIVMLSNAIIEQEQQAREKEQKLLEIKRKRFSLQKAGEEILQEIQTVKMQKEKQESEEASKRMEKVYKNLRQEKDSITLIQNVFQNIIIGSRVNWAEDPSLKDTLLQLEKNVVVFSRDSMGAAGEIELLECLNRFRSW